MDTSEKYIKMCSLAKEIQRKWMFQSGDFVYNPVFEEVEVLLYPGNNSGYRDRINFRKSVSSSL